jgi:hypothetical protein
MDNQTIIKRSERRKDGGKAYIENGRGDGILKWHF